MGIGHGQRYQVGNDLFVFGRMQVFRWLDFYAGNARGPAIYYDDFCRESAPFAKSYVVKVVSSGGEIYP